jgi:hypothetical protein
MVCEKGIAVRQDDPGAGRCRKHILPEGGNREIDRRAVLLEDPVVIRAALCGFGPEPDLLRVIDRFGHVVAGSEPQTLQRRLQ